MVRSDKMSVHSHLTVVVAATWYMLPLTSVETKPNSKEIRDFVYAVCPDVVAAVEDIARDIVDAYARL